MSWIKSRTGLYVLAGILLFLNLWVLNFIFSRHFGQLDLTEGHIYTLSKSTKEVLKNLDDIVNIHVYFSKQLPPNLLPIRETVEDILAQYTTYAKGNLKVDFKDPKDDPKLESQVMRLGIPPVQMNVFQKDRLEVVQGYLGIAVQYGDQSQVIPVVDNPENLEYELTSRILKVTKGRENTVALYLDGGSHKEADDYTLIRQEIEKEYKVIDVLPGNEVSPEADVLVVAGVENLEPKDFFNIDQYIMKGGKVIFLIDGVKIGKNLEATSVEIKKLNYTSDYGIKVNPDLVLDLSNEIAPFSSGYLRFFVHYPFWVKITKNGFNRENPVVRQLESLVLPWPSSIEVLDTTENVTVLVNTSPKSWLMKGVFNINPQGIRAPNPKVMKSYPVAVAILGKFKSYFKDHDLPEGVSDTSVIYESPETQIAVVANSRFLGDAFVQSYHENVVFFLNLLDWMAFGEELIAIRSKGITDRPLRSLSATSKTIFKVFNTYGVAFLVVLFGLVRYGVQRRKRRAKTV